jgi:hypothetical protein
MSHQYFNGRFGGIFFAEQLKSSLISNEQVEAFLDRAHEGLTKG